MFDSWDPVPFCKDDEYKAIGDFYQRNQAKALGEPMPNLPL